MKSVYIKLNNLKTEEIEKIIISEFEHFDDWMDKYNYIIEAGKSLSALNEKYKTDNYVITGCQSKVWLHAFHENDKIFFEADSDALITKGIISLLVRILSGQPPDDITNAKLEFIDKIGLREHLSPTRSNGLNSMIKQMKLYALAFKLKMSQNNSNSF